MTARFYALFFYALTLGTINSVMANTLSASELALRREALRAIPIAGAMCNRELYKLSEPDLAASRTPRRFEGSCDQMSWLPFALDVKSRQLDKDTLDIFGFHFGEAYQGDTKLALSRGPRIVPLARAAIRKPASCLGYSQAEILFSNWSDPGKKPACANHVSMFKLQSILATKFRKPPYNRASDYHTAAHFYSSEKLSRQGWVFRYAESGVKHLPAVASGHRRTKGEPGWPAWFRVGVFIDVLGLEKHPAVDGPLLDLADFSLGADADAALQRALLGRGARLVPLLQKRLRTPPQYLDYSELERGLMAANGVKALSVQERNAVLQQVLSGLTAPRAKLPQRDVAKAK
jgi:hypothetical protein